MDAKLVKELREKSGAGMMDCKKALVATDGDIQKAMEYLREQGLAATNKDVAMHIAAANPTYVSKEEVPEAEVEHEKEILKHQALNEGKPEKIVDKMVEGRIGKFYKEICLLEQPFVKNPDITIEDLVKEQIMAIGENVKIRRFARFQLGEGIEKKQENFAEEVAAQMK